MSTFLDAIDTGLIVTLTAVFVAGLAAVLGIWMERDERKPARYAFALSALIVLATLVSLMQSILDQQEQDQIKDDMARLLTTMDKLASETENPELLDLVKAEMSAQSRNNPEVVEKVAQRVSDEGRDPSEVLGKHLDAADMEKVTRKGTVKPKHTDKTANDEPAKTKTAAAEPKREAKAAPTPAPDPAAMRAAMMSAAQAGAAGRPIVPPVLPAAGTAPAGTTPPLETAAAPTPTPTPATRALPPGAPPGMARVRTATPRTRTAVKPKKPTPRQPKPR